MWVEKCVNLSMIYSSTSSSSLWGCELKNPISVIRKLATSHPPCEDVSWKSNIARGSSDYLVILLVRMWVENTPPINVMIPTLRHPPCEDVSWKDNIADIDGGWFGHPPCEDVSWKGYANDITLYVYVILLVRMWVEKWKIMHQRLQKRSSSLWGCELKNCMELQDITELQSSSLWGCELKSSWSSSFHACPPSSSLWGCELKKLMPYFSFPVPLVILLVRMWVENFISSPR